jgi:hypothetical protein
MTVESATTYEVYVKGSGGWALEPRLVLEELSLPVWPEVPICRLRAVLSNVGVSSARFVLYEALAAWPIDKEVLVKIAGAGGACMFWGRITGPSPSWSATDESVTFVARHITADLGDFFVIGSHGRAYGDYSDNGAAVESQQTYFPGWAAILNPDDKPNMTIAPYKPDAENEMCRLFGPANHLSLVNRWTTKKFLSYLIYWAVQDSAAVADNIIFPDIAALGESDLVSEPPDFVAEGLSYIEAMHRLLEREGWRGRCETGGTGTSPTASVVFWELNHGTHRTLVLGAAGTDVTAADNAQQGALDFDASGIVTRPQLVGGPLIIEGTWQLYPAWLTADLEETSSVGPDGNADFDEPSTWTQTYYKRYVKDNRAADFLQYCNAGRKWALNEMGDYHDVAYGHQPVWSPPDGYGVWAKRPRRFGACLSYDAQHRPLPAYVEVSYDAGTHWHDFTAQVLEDEAGVYIDAVDLGAIKVPDTSGADYDNFWEAVQAEQTAGTKVLRLRITATLADDSALSPDPALTTPAWSLVQRATQFYFDRKKQYARRVRLATGDNLSRYIAAGKGAYTRDQTENLTAEAARIQGVSACISVRGPVQCFGTNWPYRPGDVITKIEGREISLAQSSGGSPVYAEVVSVTLRALASQSLEVCLEDSHTRMGPGGVTGGRPRKT